MVYSIAAVTGATSYTWNVPSGSSSTPTSASPTASTSITVTFGSNSGYISVTASNACGTSNASTLLVTVYQTFTAGSISNTGTTICYNTTPGIINGTTAASGGDNSITYQWQSGTDGSTFPTTIGSSNSASYTPLSGLTATTYYRRQAHMEHAIQAGLLQPGYGR